VLDQVDKSGKSLANCDSWKASYEWKKVRDFVALVAEDESLYQQQAIPLYRGFPSG
jgi:hypothetical protein